jgi:hypothetical protein
MNYVLLMKIMNRYQDLTHDEGGFNTGKGACSVFDESKKITRSYQLLEDIPTPVSSIMTCRCGYRLQSGLCSDHLL